MIAVIFEAKTNPNQQERYLQLANELRPLLEEIERFISIERFRSLTVQGKILSLSWWRDENAVLAWRNNVFHQAAQIQGRESIFLNYTIRVAHVARAYSLEDKG
ncbi:antibiotic biosynthesis monooxygenase family protein [Hafnia alvei]|uniref:antibiotic biosynthesis monooxygenase family protein n=1 Tax=Hafnia alvei TaxID=569 RepID=UPI004043AB23